MTRLSGYFAALAAGSLALTAAFADAAEANKVRLQDKRGIFETPEFSSLDFSSGAQFDQLTFQDTASPESEVPASSLASSPCPPSGKRVRKIAVIGAGPSGSSAAWFLGKAQDKLRTDWQGARSGSVSCEEELEVTVFEKEERIGGRTAVTYPYDDPANYEPVELGASIFADVNRNMVRAAKYFNLTTGAHLGEEGSVTAIWDGQQFVVEDLGDGWWNSAKMLWRYGYAPVTTKNLVKELKDRFLQVYDAAWLHKTTSAAPKSGYPWRSIESFADALGFTELAAVTTLDHFYHNARIAKLFVQEVVEAATRVNYGQNTDELHALGGGVSLAASGATGIVDGNYRVFESMIGDSGAKLRLGHHGEVTGIIKFDNAEDAIASGKLSSEEAKYWSSGTTKYHVGTISNFGDLYDAVFVGTPWGKAGISLLNSGAYIPSTEYVHLHVTLLVTNASAPRGEYFGRGHDDLMPTTILTTNVAVRKDDRRRTSDTDSTKHPRLDFNSLNYMKKLVSPKRDGEGLGAEEHLVKIFSSESMSDAKLKEIFGERTVGWIYRKEWDAYPYLRPTREFPPLVVDERLFYINALEPLVSTMETSTVSARNAVALLLQEWYGEEFIHGGKNCDRASKEGKEWAEWGCRSA